MKLSDAIRLGAMLRPQGTHFFLRLGKSCAMGAALEAIGVPIDDLGKSRDRTNEQMAIDIFYTRPEYKEWGKINKRANNLCPSCGSDEGSITDVIVCLNNNHRWTRERIADWVATLEAQAEVGRELVDVELGREA